MEALQDALVTAKATARKDREGHLGVLTTLRNGKVDKDLSFAQLTDEVLTAEMQKLSSEVDMAKIVDKLGDGMSREPTGTVVAPNAIRDDKQSEQNQKSSLPSVETLVQIQEQYYKLLFSKGTQTADAYIKRLQMEGKLPQDSEIK